MSLYSIENYLRNSDNPVDNQLAHVVEGVLRARGGNDIPLSALAEFAIDNAGDPAASSLLPLETDDKDSKEDDCVLILHNPNIEDLKNSPAQLESAANNRYALDTAAIEQVTTPYLGLFDKYRPVIPAPRFNWLTPKKREHQIPFSRSNRIGRFAMDYDGIVTFTSIGHKTDLQEVNITAAPRRGYSPDVKFAVQFQAGTISACEMRDNWHPGNPAYHIFDTDSVLAGSESASFTLTGETPTLLLDHGRHAKGGPRKALFKFDPINNIFAQHALTTNPYPTEAISVDEYTFALSRLLGIIPTSNLSELQV